jgi:hypothetical protein
MSDGRPQKRWIDAMSLLLRLACLPFAALGAIFAVFTMLSVIIVISGDWSMGGLLTLYFGVPALCLFTTMVLLRWLSRRVQHFNP